MIDKSANDRNAMSLGQILQWAWSETAPVHRSRLNLLIHVVAVPMFVVGHIVILPGFFLDLRLLIAAPLLVAASLMLQKFGHSLEERQVHAFSGPLDFVRRLYIEQFCNFWRFLFSGQWYASFTAADDRP